MLSITLDSKVIKSLELFKNGKDNNMYYNSILIAINTPKAPNCIFSTDGKILLMYHLEDKFDETTKIDDLIIPYRHFENFKNHKHITINLHETDKQYHSISLTYDNNIKTDIFKVSRLKILNLRVALPKKEECYSEKQAYINIGLLQPFIKTAKINKIDTKYIRMVSNGEDKPLYIIYPEHYLGLLMPMIASRIPKDIPEWLY